MPDILATLYHDNPLSLATASCLDEPQSEEERRLATQLRAVEEMAAEALKPSIEKLADKKAEESFYNGVRFGARLMAELCLPSYR